MEVVKMFKSKILMIMMMLTFLALDAKSQVKPTKCELTETSYNLPCMKQELDLVDAKILIKIYTKPMAGKIIDRTFVVVHANEEKGLDAAKKVISANYGRLVEVISKKNGENQRYLYFGDGKCIDPNRIYTKKGIKDNLKDPKNPCRNNNPEVDSDDKIYKFGVALLSKVTKNNTYSFIIGVHNNDDSLSLNNWSKDGDDGNTAFGTFRANSHQHDTDKDMLDTDSHNFVLVTNSNLFAKLFNGFYFIALQENREYLTKPVDGTSKRVLKDSLDDGSMSIYFGSTLFGTSSKPFDYIIIEAGGKDNPRDNQVEPNKEWQKKIIKFALTMKR
jgi:hypothetical protein